jgi:hypothetical protein
MQQALQPAPTDPCQIPTLPRQEGTDTGGHDAIVSGAQGRSNTEADPDLVAHFAHTRILCDIMFALILRAKRDQQKTQQVDTCSAVAMNLSIGCTIRRHSV